MISTHFIIIFLVLMPAVFHPFPNKTDFVSIYYLCLTIVIIGHAHTTRYYSEGVAATIYIPHLSEYIAAWLGIFIASGS
jgi:hypothetical protein